MNDFNSGYPRPPYNTSYTAPQSSAPKYHQEEIVVGENLENYTRRVPSEDGTYVKVTSHSERIEKVKQPPTPEEKAAQQKAERIGMAVVGGIVAAFFAVVGYAIYKDEQDTKRHLHPVPDRD